MESKNKENFLKLVSEHDAKTMLEVIERVENRDMLRELQQIALKALIKLDELGLSKKDLAKALRIGSDKVDKMLTGTENLTLETMIMLQKALEIPILATYYEKKKADKTLVKFEDGKY